MVRISTTRAVLLLTSFLLAACHATGSSDEDADSGTDGPVGSDAVRVCTPAPVFTLPDLNPESVHYLSDRSVSDIVPGTVLLIYFANYA